jgi:predicted metal-dependent phosphotriesterase family hydrolase
MFEIFQGFYVKESQSESLLNSSVEELANIIRGDLLDGCQEMADVKCGVIAEVGSGWPISGDFI